MYIVRTFCILALFFCFGAATHSAPQQNEVTQVTEKALSSYIYPLTQECRKKIIASVQKLPYLPETKQKNLQEELESCLDKHSHIFTQEQATRMKQALSQKTKDEKTSPVHYRLLNNDTAYIQLKIFEKGVAYWHFEKLFPRLRKDKVKNVVLDLRDNPGGFTVEGLRIAYHFSKNFGDTIVVRKFKNHQRRHSIYTERGQFMERGGVLNPEPGTMTQYKTVLLINKKTGSIAEVVAGALQDWGIPLIGTPSYGKGVAQKLTELSNGVLLVLSYSESLVGNKKTRINRVGVIPDVFVQDTRQDKERDTGTIHDAQFQFASELVSELASELEKIKNKYK